jgi:hypothetical protein
MALGEPIKLRLPLEKHLAYEQESERLGKTLAAFLRERLELAGAVRTEIETLRRDLGGEIAALGRDLAGLHHKVSDLHHSIEAHGPRDANGEPSAGNAILTELLLLLRAAAAPDRMAMIHAELRRLGMEVWTYNSGKP